MFRSLALGAAMLAATALPALAQDNFFAGKNITLIMGLGAGGNADILARNIARYLERHIPGNPTIVVQNLPGGGGLRATNEVYGSEPDGLSVYFGPWDPLAQILESPELRAKYEEFGFVGGTADLRLNQIRKDVVPGGLTKPGDVVKATGTILTGDLNASSPAGLLGRMSMEVIGAPVKLVTGYNGGSEVYAAILRNEIQMQNIGVSTWRTRSVDFVKSGTGMGLWYFVPVEDDGSYKPNALLPELQPFPDVYKEVHGKMPEGPLWDALNWYTKQIGEMTFVALLPPKTPEDRLKTLQDAFVAAMNDPEFVAESVKTSGAQPAYIDGQRGASIFADLANVTPQVKETMKAVIEAGNQ